MKVLNYQAHNVLKISDISFDLSGHHLFLVGGDNEQGKTSSLTALLMALCGRSGMDWPDVSLKEGEDEGWVKVSLSGDQELHDSVGFTLELYLRRKRDGQIVESFRLLDSAGEPAPEPRTLLKQLYHYKGFDPLEFARLPKMNKRRLLMELVGIDFTGDEQRINKIYQERTQVNRAHKAVRAELGRLTWQEDAPEEEVSTFELMGQLESRQTYNAETKTLNAKAAMKAKCADLAVAQIEDEKNEIELLEAEIAERKRKIQKLAEEAKEFRTEQTKILEQTATREVKDVDQVKQQIKDAGQINARVRDNQKILVGRRKEEELRRRSQELTEQIKSVEADQQRRLKEAEWPVEGLSVDSEGVLFNGLPFEQASTSQRTIISTKIGMALNPKLRLLVCQGGSDLGNGTLDALEKLLEEEDFQMVLELITRSKDDENRCAVIIENGRLR